jgi:hypothetical protein
MRKSNDLWLAARAWMAAVCLVMAPSTSRAQGKTRPPGVSKPAKTDTSLAARLLRDSLERRKLAKLPHDSSKIASFYAASTPLAITLTTNIRRLRDDKTDNAPYRPATLSYIADGKPVVVPARVRTRGIWRLKTCDFPPLRVNFTSEDTKKTVFKGIDKPKLVSYCLDSDLGDQYLLQEFQLYRIYRLLTPASHAPRLARITYLDSATGKARTTRYAFFTEDPDALAARMSGRMLDVTGAGPSDVAPYPSALVGVFSYLIGNTDFAISALHNAEIISRDNGDVWSVVYDFDFAGAVNARYATPDPRFHTASVRDRIYRGYCVPVDEYPKVFSLFNEKKDAIYSLYRDEIGQLLRKETVDATLRYFDDFYKTINDPRAAKENIVDACLGKK